MKYEGKQKFKIEHYWHDDINCTVEIDFDHPTVMVEIKEMVEFWPWWESRLYRNQGDYVKTFLKQLGVAVAMRSSDNKFTQKMIKDFAQSEGWSALDGSVGIKLLGFNTIQVDDDDFQIKQL
jgi:hypothetical protein